MVTALAATTAVMMALAGCGGSSSSGSSGSSSSSAQFVAGGLFPQTGSLAYLGPAEVAAFKLAVKDINAAGGVLDKDVTTATADSSDADHADQNTAGAESILSKNPSVMVGPPSSAVVKNTYKEVTEAKVPMISNGATSTSLSGINDYFFRTVPPDTVQGAVLGSIIAQDGVSNLAIEVFNDEYGTSLRDVVVKTVEAAGVKVVYGAKSTFDPTETNFSSLVTAVKATKPDAVLVIAFDQTKALVKEMAAQGLDTNTMYMTDGNTADYSDTFSAGLLKGTKGTIPGAHPSDAFQERLKTIDSSLVNFTYAAETYDAIILSALAAQKGGAVDGATVQKNLAAVSGADGGTKCTSFKECLTLLKDGKSIQYSGQAGIGAFNSDNDPSSASIGIYKFDGDNKPVFDTSQTGEVPKG
ncbi:branched-chain amino acid transporter substrate-binding protein [Bifidobacterium minimum]|uniref:Branched-chain amino acid transporter substrate-binding protein n=2 Tax=Bifidobacterium minimum TaxID=1693 RepID=A0A087BSP7_9BIFI|nr:branched-chain amino acid transporter substrate-binding protein [Bifidobacterium minimum]